MDEEDRRQGGGNHRGHVQEDNRLDEEVSKHVSNPRNRSHFVPAKLLIYLAGVAGLEPATPGFGDRCSTN